MAKKFSETSLADVAHGFHGAIDLSLMGCEMLDDSDQSATNLTFTISCLAAIIAMVGGKKFPLELISRTKDKETEELVGGLMAEYSKMLKEES